MIYIQLIWVYLKIGLFGFGGGYAMLSLIQDEVVNHYHWLSPQEFTDIVAISQVTPGPIGINSATYIGYSVTGSVWGAVLATIAVCLPSFLLVLLISFSFARFRRNRWVDAAFRGIRPASVGLIASAALLLMFRSGFLAHIWQKGLGSIAMSDIIVAENFPDVRSLFIFLGTMLAMFKRWLDPIVLIGLAGIVGFLLYYFF